MIRNGEGSLDAAALRLNRAVEALEARIAAQAARPETPPSAAAASEATDALEIALREARLRERALEGAAAEASTVLGRAAEQIRAALEDQPDDDGNAAPLTADADAAGGGDEDEGPTSLDHLSDDQTDFHPSTREY